MEKPIPNLTPLHYFTLRKNRSIFMSNYVKNWKVGIFIKLICYATAK